MVFSPFIVDATATLLARIAKGDRVWEAHRTHFYQRLVRSGWGHRRTVLWGYLLMVAVSLSSVIALTWSPAGQRLLLSGWALTYTILMVMVYRVDAAHRTRSNA